MNRENLGVIAEFLNIENARIKFPGENATD